MKPAGQRQGYTAQHGALGRGARSRPAAQLRQYMPRAAVQLSDMARVPPGCGASSRGQVPRTCRRRCTSRSGTSARPCRLGGRAGMHPR